ncbi:MAG TPA: hypothetical protein EYQ21_07120 [Flavobacteriales bacterium]|jgi:hypothetical protein|nr:hypothetical protein [Flavobacteriales bacterium]
MEATLIKTYKSDEKSLTQDLYSMSNPVEYEVSEQAKETDYVIASRSCIPITNEWEVYLFPSDEDGNILDYSELYGEKGWHKTSDIMDRYMRHMEKHDA